MSVHSHAFTHDPFFLRAYARGVKAIGGVDTYQCHWRVHVGLWAAQAASRLEGDFIECGVNRGFLSSAIMQSLNWNAMDRDFYLLDTFAGLDRRYVSEAERRGGALDMNADALETDFYVRGVHSVRENFAEWPRARSVEGSIPQTLEAVTATQVAYLHLDMNCAPPEVAATGAFLEPARSCGTNPSGPLRLSGLHAAKTCHGHLRTRAWRQGMFATPLPGTDANARHFPMTARVPVISDTRAV